MFGMTSETTFAVLPDENQVVRVLFMIFSRDISKTMQHSEHVGSGAVQKCAFCFIL